MARLPLYAEKTQFSIRSWWEACCSRPAFFLKQQFFNHSVIITVMFSFGPIGIILRAGTGVALTLWVCDFGKEKTFKYFSSPFALFHANLRVPHLCFVIWGHISSHTCSYNSLEGTKSECLLIPSAEQPCLYALSQTHKRHTLAFCREGKDVEGEDGTRTVSKAPFLQHSNL